MNANPENMGKNGSNVDVTSETPSGLIWTRAGILLLVAFVTWITIAYCSQVYYDREGAFRAALECSGRVLREHKVDHWLQNGTLLGATRLGRLVLWDADLDFGFLLREGSEFDGVSMALDETCFGTRATRRPGVQLPQWRVWRKCTNRICADFHETHLVKGSGADGEQQVVTGDGMSPAAELLPLSPCKVADVETMCPHNAPYYLAQAYGSDWLTRPLTKLF